MMHTFHLRAITETDDQVLVTCIISLIGVSHNQQVVTRWPDMAAAHRYLQEESKQAFWAALDRWADYISALCPHPTALQVHAINTLREAHWKIGEKQSDCTKVTALISRAGDLLRNAIPDSSNPYHQVLSIAAKQCVADAQLWLRYLDNQRTLQAA